MKKLVIAAVAIAAVAAPALAGHVQPGLWEGAVTRDKPMAGMRNLPPEVLARLKAQGIDINGATIKTRICISPAMANRDAVDSHQVEGCKILSTRFAGNTQITDSECKLANIVSRSHSEITFESQRHYFGKIASDSTVAGKPHHSEMMIDARFLGPNCGGVKPLMP